MSLVIEQMLKSYDVEFENSNIRNFGYCTSYTEWLWVKGKEPVSAILYIWNSGDIVYRISC